MRKLRQYVIDLRVIVSAPDQEAAFRRFDALLQMLRRRRFCVSADYSGAAIEEVTPR